MVESILIVCIGNICRSPMAEALFKSTCPDTLVRSAGISALIGYPADPIAQELLHERGLDVSEHRAQQVSLNLCNASDVILVMDSDQKRLLEARYPVVRGKIFRLGEIGKFDIPDPFRQGRPQFERSLELIERGVADWVSKMNGWS